MDSPFANNVPKDEFYKHTKNDLASKLIDDQKSVGLNIPIWVVLFV
jgi:hypothetical protein